MLRVGTGRTEREQFGRNSNETGKQKLLAIQLRSKSRHRVEKTACQFFAGGSGIIDMLLQIAVQVVYFGRAIRQPLARVPAGVKFSGTENCLCALRHWQSRIKNRAADFQMRIERFARDEQPHDLARTL